MREGYIPYIPSGKKAIANHIVLHFDMVGEKKKDGKREIGEMCFWEEGGGEEGGQSAK